MTALAVQQMTTQLHELLPYMSAAERSRFESVYELVLLESDWRVWARTMFPSYIKGDFSNFHAHCWDWFWSLEPGVTGDDYLAIWPRFYAKSTTFQMGLVACGARGTRRYIWYISETQDQANAHVQTIGSLLSNSRLGEFYPDMAKPRLGMHGQTSGWRRNRFWTASDFIVDALGLDTAGRGVKLEEKRPDLEFFDDFDGKHDSPHIVTRKIETITTSLMPAAGEQCNYAFGQNMIHRDGIAAQLEDGRLKLLKNRRFFGIVPAVRDLKWERDAEGFGLLTAGTSSWPYMTMEKLQAKVDQYGIEAFLLECQHDVNMPLAGAILGEFDEIYNVITDEEFAEGWAHHTGEELRRTPDGRVQMPYQFTISRFQDVGTTKAHPNVTSWWNRPPMVSGFDDFVFSHRELVFPKTWWDAKDTFDPFSIGMIAQDIYDTEMMYGERHRINDADCFISHEGTSEVRTYDFDVEPHLRIAWTKWQGDYRKMIGVSIMKNFIRVNPLKPHPFRKYPAGHPNAGEYLMGCPRLMLIVKKGQGELFIDPETGQLKVKKAIDADGMRRARWEIPLYRLPTMATGEEKDVPKRIDDDWISTAKAAAAVMFPQPKPMNREQRAAADLAKVAPEYTDEAIEARPVEDRQGAKFRRDLILSDLRQRHAPSKPTNALSALRDLRKKR